MSKFIDKYYLVRETLEKVEGTNVYHLVQRYEQVELTKKEIKHIIKTLDKDLPDEYYLGSPISLKIKKVL